MYASIKGATHHIHLQSYIFEDDRTGLYFKDLLVKKASQGVEVKVLVDGVGSFFLKEPIINEMREAGVEVIVFSPLRLIMPFSRINYRNHRKILIIDGKSAFIGGVNIADRYYYGTTAGEWPLPCSCSVIVAVGNVHTSNKGAFAVNNQNFAVIPVIYS